jgi:hypothetical protein
VAVQHASIDYAMAEILAIVTWPWRTTRRPARPLVGIFISRSSDDLLKRSQLIETATGLGRTLVVLIKEIGSDALFALHMVARRRMTPCTPITSAGSDSFISIVRRTIWRWP